MTDRFQPIYDIASICAGKGITNAVLCPGSRNAPLVLAFTRHPQIKSRTFSDERSAAFIALGLAQNLKQATILLCTSGSAAYNFAPAVAEAYFGHTPLIIFTADRPAEWISQMDGQAIHQAEIFGKHVKKSFQLPQDYEHRDSKWAINRIVNEAINLSMQEPKGPVHINAPFREPLYPKAEATWSYSDAVRVIEEFPTTFDLTEEQKETIEDNWLQNHHVLLVAGQQDLNPEHIEALRTIWKHHNIPILGDVISNLHPLDAVVSHADLFLSQASAAVKKSLAPDLLITFGGSVVSKQVKTFLREYPAKTHWHIQCAGSVPDTFQSVTRIFRTNTTTFLNFIGSLPRPKTFESQKQENYGKLWEVEERRAVRTLENFFPQKDFAEFEFVREVINHLPATCNLHLANSMSVRYTNYIGLNVNHHLVQVYSNRGTSGIDGCTSTAVGHALAKIIPNILITGDLAFFYDRNAFWHNYPLPNLRIVLLNNHGGLIFKMIDGPGSVPESEEFFVTRQALNAKKLCEEFDFDYLKLDSKRKLKNLMKDFFDFDGRTKILELETDTAVNTAVFDYLRLKIKESYEL
jgi:2-succinyl-5-enolpyruvyl-6-hydroxy-3-cyclohexene-1-carboxylate synthase